LDNVLVQSHAFVSAVAGFGDRHRVSPSSGDGFRGPFGFCGLKLEI
jgi:hypothetical protein